MEAQTMYARFDLMVTVDSDTVNVNVHYDKEGPNSWKVRITGPAYVVKEGYIKCFTSIAPSEESAIKLIEQHKS